MPLRVSNKGAKRTVWRQALGEKSSPCVKPVVESPRARSLRPREERRGDGPGKLRTGRGSRGPRVERGRPHRGAAVRTRTPASSWVRPGAPPPCSQGMASESAPWFPPDGPLASPGPCPAPPGSARAGTLRSQHPAHARRVAVNRRGRAVALLWWQSIPSPDSSHRLPTPLFPLRS